MVRLRILLLSTFLITFLSGCSNMAARYFEELGIQDVQVSDFLDSHGGFHGDGLTQVYGKIDGSFNVHIFPSRYWKPSNVDSELLLQLFSGSDKKNLTNTYEGYFKSDNSLKSWPEDFSDGMYYFENKQEEGYARYSEDVFLKEPKASVNIRFCFVDRKTRECWYFELDT
jgi:hypothetical protein